MRNIDIETLYGKIKPAIETACSYIGNKDLDKLIISCRLKPISCFDNKCKNKSLIVWWVDEFGNSMMLVDNKISTILRDKNIKHNTQISTDLFCCRSIIDTMAISKSLVLVDDVIMFYGQDEYFRCFNKNNCARVSALEIDTDTIFEILYFINYKHKKTDKFIIYKLPNSEIETILRKEYSNE